LIVRTINKEAVCPQCLKRIQVRAEASGTEGRWHGRTAINKPLLGLGEHFDLLLKGITCAQIGKLQAPGIRQSEIEKTGMEMQLNIVATFENNLDHIAGFVGTEKMLMKCFYEKDERQMVLLRDIHDQWDAVFTAMKASENAFRTSYRF
jgi:hypothetical protein